MTQGRRACAYHRHVKCRRVNEQGQEQRCVKAEGTMGNSL